MVKDIIMADDATETICIGCWHCDVCKHKEMYLEFLKAQKNLYAKYGKCIEFIKQDVPACKFHGKNRSNIR